MYYPNYFKKSFTIVLQKPSGKKPIVLLNILGKALKSVLATHISYLVETYALLPKTYIGGKKGWFTEDALHKIVEKICSG